MKWTQEQAQNFIKVREALIREDYEDAWHYLYAVASPQFDKYEPWEKIENIAKGIEILNRKEE